MTALAGWTYIKDHRFLTKAELASQISSGWPFHFSYVISK